MTDDRPLFCCMKDCNGEPKVYPAFLMWARGYPKVRGEECRAVMEMPICSKCAQTLKFEDLITDEGWDQIEKGFTMAGKPLPNRYNAEIDFVPMQKIEDALESFDEGRHGPKRTDPVH